MTPAWDVLPRGAAPKEEEDDEAEDGDDGDAAQDDAGQGASLERCGGRDALGRWR